MGSLGMMRIMGMVYCGKSVVFPAWWPALAFFGICDRFIEMIQVELFYRDGIFDFLLTIAKAFH
jgi:hypothetical protein